MRNERLRQQRLERRRVARGAKRLHARLVSQAKGYKRRQRPRSAVRHASGIGYRADQSVIRRSAWKRPGVPRKAGGAP